MKTVFKYLLIALLPAVAACSPKPGGESEEINDSTTPLHLLKPDYKTPYGELSEAQIKENLDRVFFYIDSVTPAVIVDSLGNKLTDLTSLPDGAQLNKGTFRLTSYEWAVTYMALLKASEILNDTKYKDYTTDRVGFLASNAKLFKELLDKSGHPDGQMRQVAAPATLDDAGAMAGAFMLTAMADSSLNLSEAIERYYNIIDNKTLRLDDGTIARNRPHYNAVWLDDMFMALPAMAIRSVYSNDPAAMDNAAASAKGFIKRMWMPEKNLFRHGYLENHKSQPSFAWGRANGWALLTLCNLLDYLPENHKDRPVILETLQNHIKGLASLQGPDGFWHQVLDRNDSYEETSATAIFTYCIAHAVNEGWIEAEIYAPVAHLGWEAVASKINPKGEVEGVCVGTGMGFDPAFYYYRPVSTKAAHGYGPTIMAAAEMVRLINNRYPKMNDAAVHYYEIDPESDSPIFSLDPQGKAVEILH